MLDGLDYSNFEEELESGIGSTSSLGFQEFDLSSFVNYLSQFKWGRSITTIQIHHTWIPNYSHFNKTNHQALQQGMKNYHIKAGYGDIAQHITIFPDGRILLGRDFNKIPAGISNRNTGAFCIEQVGDFDKGQDVQTKAQEAALVGAVKQLKKIHNAKIVYHSEFSTKTCPGSGFMSKEELERKINDDVTGHWAEKEIRNFQAMGILGGFPDGTFRPDDPMTRAQFAAALSRFVKVISENTQNPFK